VERTLGDVIICEPVLLEQPKIWAQRERRIFNSARSWSSAPFGLRPHRRRDYKKMKAKERSLKIKAEKLLTGAERN
jgi:hypothetical protein